MSSQSPFTAGRNRAARPTVPRGDVVGSYETYPEAQKAVDELARADFPVNRVSIVGSDLKTVERVTGKLTWGRVALAGAASGAWLGVFFGVLLAMFSAGVNLGLIIAAVLIGAGFGMLFGVASYAINRRRRDFTSMTQVLASRYDVIVDPALGMRARAVLGADAAPVAGPGAGPGGAGPSAGHRDGGREDDRRSGAAAEPGRPAHPPARPRYGEYSDAGRDAAAGDGDAAAHEGDGHGSGSRGPGSGGSGSAESGNAGPGSDGSGSAGSGTAGSDTRGHGPADDA